MSPWIIVAIVASLIAFPLFMYFRHGGGPATSNCRHAWALNQVDYTKDYRTSWTVVYSYCRSCGIAKKDDLQGTIPAVNACLRAGVLYIDPIYTITGDKPYRDGTKILDARAGDGLGLHQSVAPMNYNELTGAKQ